MENENDNKNESTGATRWWVVAGMVLTGATGLGVGYALANREKPCACKLKDAHGPAHEAHDEKKG
jgi:hypothetical protein